MALNETSKEFISLKKLQGKAHTSNNKDLANEALSSGLTVSAKTVFSTDIPSSPTSTQYAISGGAVQFVRLSASFIPGSDTVNGRHAFALSLPDDYESPNGTTNSLAKAGSGVFVDGKTLNTTGGALQLVPPSYGVGYEAKPFSFVDGGGDPTQIPVLDARDWYIDYFNGILFQQDPPGTGDHASNPRLVDAYIYVGDFVSDALAAAGTGSGDGDKSAQYVVLSATGSLPNERVLTPGAGIAITDAGAGGAVTLSVEIDGLTELAEAPHATEDDFLISDNGTEKRVNMTNVAAGAFALVSGDATIGSDGALTIAANSIEDSMINDNVAAGLAGDGLSESSGVLSVGVDDSTIETSGDALRIKDAGVTNAKLQNSGITFARVGGNSTVASLGGTVSFQGSAGEVTVGENSGVFTIGLPDNVAITTGLTVNGVEATTNTATQTLTNKTLTSPVLNGTISGTSIKDEDDFASNSATHLATQQSIKAYVDSQIAGLDVKASVSAATTSSFTMASTASSSTLVLADGEGGFDATANTLTIDGVSLSAGDRVLIKDGVNSNSAGVDNKWNGVYTVGALDGSTLTLTRASDFDAGSEFTGAPFFMVGKGTNNGAHGFVSNLASSPTIGTDPITFYQFSAPGQDSVAGAGLAMSGNVLSVDIDELDPLGGTGIDQADNFIFSDGGTEKKITFSNLEDAIFSNVSGDATIAAGGALTISANSIEDGMVNDNVATGLAGTGLAAASGVLSVDLSEVDGGSNIDPANDQLVFLDQNDSNATKRDSVSDFVTAITGDGLDATSGVISIDASDIAGAGLEDDGSENLRLNIHGLSVDSNAGNLSDSIAISDASDSNLTKKITLTQLKTLIDADTTFSAGDGLDLTGTTFSLDLKSSGGLAIDSTELAIDYAGNDSVVKSATDGTSSGENITVADDDLVLIQDITDGTVKYVAASQMPGASGSGVIGAAEDGDYTDGLFTDFTTTTPTGTPIDRFNEVLKLLVPTPAPDLDMVDSNTTAGVSGDLSFGPSNDQSSASPAYITVAGSAGFGIGVDRDGLYEASGSVGSNLRRGIYDGTQDHIGDLNEDIAADITSPSSRTNFPANSFGNADIGSLILEVNGSDLVTADLTNNSTGASSPGSGTGNSINANGSGFVNLSIAANGTFDNGTSFPSFKHRTGRWKVAAADQRNGWNYVRVKHDKGGGSVVTTNYVEWVNDNNSDALTASSNSLTFQGAGSKQISGVTYFTTGDCRYQVTVSNAYKYVYDKTTNHTFTTSASGTRSGVSYSIDAIAPADIGGGDHTKQISVDEVDSVTADYILGGSITAGINVAHPVKANLTNGGQASATGILLYNVTDTATALSETFEDETFRLQAGTYANQSDAASGNSWDSTQSLTATSGGHGHGLQVYRERLYSPLNTLNSGDFRNTTDGGSLANGPGSNPDYSSVTGTKTYYRRFQNTSGGAVRDFSYTIAGDVTLVGASDSIGSNDKFKLAFKMPSDGSGNSTGFLDAKNAFALGSTSDGDGGAIGTVDTSDSMTNHISFGTVEIGPNEYIVARIEASHEWTGYIETFSVAFGAVGSVASSPNVNNIDQDTDGVAANLSFGDTLTKAGYSTVENTAGGTERNANDLYALSAPRHGVLDGSSAVVGTINESTSANSNAYPANAFGSGVANTGTLKLEVNGSVIHSVDLSSFSSGDSLVGGAGTSGFTSLSAATNGRDGSNLPDFTKWWRTGSWRVATANQRTGWNYVRVIHTISGTDHESTYVEWVNDPDSSTISYSGVAVSDFTESGTSYSLSGVTYFQSPVGKFHFTVANLYKYVYSDASNAISFPTSTNCTFTQIIAAGTGVTNATTNAAQSTLPVLDTSVSAAHDQNLIVTGSFSVDSSTSIPGNLQNVTIIGRTHHPLKGNTDTSSTASGNLLIFTDTDTSTTLVENFDGEAKRLKSGTYTQQSHVTAGSSAWDSSVSLVHGSDTAHNAGLMVFNEKLVGFVGEHNTNTDFGALIGPSANPDYSSVSAGTREYIRWFRNTEGAARQMFQITINGTGTIVNSSGTLGANNNLMVHFKIPSTNASQSTGWMDLAATFATGEYGDDAGCFDSGNGAFDSSLNATNWGTFGTHFVNNNEYILIRVKAYSTWTGNISQLTLSWRTA